MGCITDQLQREFNDITKKGGFVELIRELREDSTAKYRIPKHRITTLFENAHNWSKVPQAGGHTTYRNDLTGISVCWQNHNGKKKSSDLPPNQAVAMMNQLQEHVNLIGNHFFGYVIRNWKSVPDFNTSAARYANWTVRLRDLRAQ